MDNRAAGDLDAGYDELKIISRGPILNSRNEPIGEECVTEDFRFWTRYNQGIAHTSVGDAKGLTTNGTMLVPKPPRKPKPVEDPRKIAACAV